MFRYIQSATRVVFVTPNPRPVVALFEKANLATLRFTGPVYRNTSKRKTKDDSPTK